MSYYYLSYINVIFFRSLNAIGTWVKLYLQAEQKKSDFKPESDDFDTVASHVSIFFMLLSNFFYY